MFQKIIWCRDDTPFFLAAIDNNGWLDIYAKLACIKWLYNFSFLGPCSLNYPGLSPNIINNLHCCNKKCICDFKLSKLSCIDFVEIENKEENNCVHWYSWWETTSLCSTSHRICIGNQYLIKHSKLIKNSPYPHSDKNVQNMM